MFVAAAEEGGVFDDDFSALRDNGRSAGAVHAFGVEDGGEEFFLAVARIEDEKRPQGRLGLQALFQIVQFTLISIGKSELLEIFEAEDVVLFFFMPPARKVAALGEAFNVRSAWHGPGDLSPIGAACNITLDVVIQNFGVQEHSPFGERVQEVFQGCPVIKNGYWYPNDTPGWGIEVNEQAAARYPFGNAEQGERKRLNGGWGEVRRRDGTIIKQ